MTGSNSFTTFREGVHFNRRAKMTTQYRITGTADDWSNAADWQLGVVPASTHGPAIVAESAPIDDDPASTATTGVVAIGGSATGDSGRRRRNVRSRSTRPRSRRRRLTATGHRWQRPAWTPSAARPSATSGQPATPTVQGHACGRHELRGAAPVKEPCSGICLCSTAAAMSQLAIPATATVGQDPPG